MTSDFVVDKQTLDILSALIAGGVFVAIHLVRKRCWPRSTFRLFATALSGPGIVASLWLFWIALAPGSDLRKIPALGDLRFYLGVGGMAVGWISGLTIARSWKQAWIRNAVEAVAGEGELDEEPVSPSAT